MEAVNTERRQLIATNLSEAVDSLISAIESGRVGFDYAVKEYADQSDNELSHAFEGYVNEMKLGDTQPVHSEAEIPDLRDERREALLNVAERINVSEITTFVEAMIEAQDKGINVVQALQSQANQLHRILRAA